MGKQAQIPQSYGDWANYPLELRDPLIATREALISLNTGNRKAVFVAGPNRIGKSREIKRQMNHLTPGRTVIYSSAKSRRELLSDLYKTMGRHPLVVLEADELIKKKDVISLLKQSLDDSLPARIVTGAKNKSLRLGAPIVLEFSQSPHSFSKAVCDNLDSLFAMQPLIEVTRDRTEIAKYCIYEALVGDLLVKDREIAANLDHLCDALNWFADNLWKLESATPETLTNIFKVFASNHSHRQPLLDSYLQNPPPVDAARFWNADWGKIMSERLANSKRILQKAA